MTKQQKKNKQTKPVFKTSKKSLAKALAEPGVLVLDWSHLDTLEKEFVIAAFNISACGLEASHDRSKHPGKQLGHIWTQVAIVDDPTADEDDEENMLWDPVAELDKEGRWVMNGHRDGSMYTNIKYVMPPKFFVTVRVHTQIDK